MKWTKDCGKEPCGCCYVDWESLTDWEDCIGTLVVPTCGDGCCHERVACDYCHGTGIDPEEDE